MKKDQGLELGELNSSLIDAFINHGNNIVSEKSIFDNPKKEDEILEKDNSSSQILNRYSFMLEDNSGNPSIFQKCIKYLGAGSFAASVFSLSSVAIGAGILSLPYVLRLTGVFLGSALIALGAIISIWSMRMLLTASDEVETRHFMILALQGGGKFIAYLLEFSIIVDQFSVVLLYQIFCADLLEHALYGFGVSSDFAFNSTFRVVQITLCSFIFCYPLSIKKEINDLRYVSILSIITIAYTILIIIIEAPSYFKKNISTSSFDFVIINDDLFDACAITFFAYKCQNGLFSVFGEFRDSTAKMKKVVANSILLDYSLYGLVAFFGYMSTLSKTDKLFVNREQLNENSIDYWMNLGRLGVFATLMLSVPITYNPLRRSLFNVLFSPKASISDKRNYIIAFCVFGLSTLLAIVFPKIRTIFSIVGGFIVVNICYIVPTVTYCNTGPIPIKNWRKILSIIICVVLTLIGWTSVIMTIIKIFKGEAE